MKIGSIRRHGQRLVETFTLAITVMLMTSPAAAPQPPSQPGIASGDAPASLGIATGSGIPNIGAGSVNSGSSSGSADSGLPLRLDPGWPPRAPRPAETGRQSGERELAVPPPTGAAASDSASSGLDTGSMLAACAGSAVAGSSAILLGILTGSGVSYGLIGPGSAVGSAGSGLGSAVLGSAVTGSAILTCLLALPSAPPPAPESPLQLPPAAQPPSMPFASAARPVPPPTTVPGPGSATPQRPHTPPPETAPATLPPAEWSPMRVMTVLVISLLAGAATTASGRHQRTNTRP